MDGSLNTIVLEIGIPSGIFQSPTTVIDSCF